jgi:hypothetical protein
LLVVVRSACRSENAAKLDCEVLRKECARESPRVQERSWCAICLRAAVQSAKPIRWLSSMSQVRFVELMVRVSPVQYVKMSSEYGLIHTATSKSNVKWFIGKVKKSCKYNTFGQQGRRRRRRRSQQQSCTWPGTREQGNETLNPALEVAKPFLV